MFGRTATKTAGKAAALGALLFAVFAGAVVPAQAAFKLEISGGTTTVTVADGDALDANGDVGSIAFLGTIDGFTINLTTGISKPLIGSAAFGELDLSTLQISGAAAGTLTIRLTDTDYGQEQVGFSLSQIGGTTQGTVSVQSYLDRGNAEFGTSDLLTDFGILTGPSFSASTVNAVTPLVNVGGTSPYALTIVAAITHGAANQVTGFDGFVATGVTESDVPAPASMAVFAFGLMALRSLRRRAQRG